MTTSIDKSAVLRGVRERGGSVSDARRLLEMVGEDAEVRRTDARERRETEMLAADLGFGSPGALTEAVAQSQGVASGGVFPQEARAAEPRGVRAAVREAENERLREKADGNREYAEMLLDEAADRRDREDLGAMLGMSEAEVETMLEQAPRLGSEVAARDDLRLAETLGIRPGELANMLGEA